MTTPGAYARVVDLAEGFRDSCLDREEYSEAKEWSLLLEGLGPLDPERVDASLPSLESLSAAYDYAFEVAEGFRDDCLDREELPEVEDWNQVLAVLGDLGRELNEEPSLLASHAPRGPLA